MNRPYAIVLRRAAAEKAEYDRLQFERRLLELESSTVSSAKTSVTDRLNKIYGFSPAVESIKTKLRAEFELLGIEYAQIRLRIERMLPRIRELIASNYADMVEGATRAMINSFGGGRLGHQLTARVKRKRTD